MTFSTDCPSCGETLDVDDDHRGWTVRCPACRHEFVAGGDEPPPRPRSRRPAPSGYGRRRDRYDEPDDEDLIDDAREAVKGPATALKVLGLIGIGLGILGVLVFSVMLAQAGNKPRNAPANNPRNNNPFLNKDKDPAELVGNVVGSVLNVVFGVLTLVGAGKMSRLENRGWAMASAILAIIPCTNGCCLIGLPIGIWALTVLNRNEVADGFFLVARGRGHRRRDWDEDDDYE